MIRIFWLLVCAALSAVFLYPRKSEASCNFYQANDLPAGYGGYQWAAADLPVPVWLHVPSTASTAFGLNTAGVEAIIGKSIDQINRYGMSGFRLQYAGTRNNPLFLPGQKGIIIRQSNACVYCGGESAAGCTYYPNLDASGNVVNVIIEIKYLEGDSCTPEWAAYPQTAGGTCPSGGPCLDDLQGTITHELLHAAGLAHSGSNGNCQPDDDGSVGVMAGGFAYHTEKRYLSRDDADGLAGLYGRLVGTLDYHFSYDGALSWSDGGLLGSQNVNVVPSSTSHATSTLDDEQWLGYHDNVFLGSYRQMTYTSAGTASAFSASSHHPIAAASTAGVVMVARFINASRTDNSKMLRLSRTVDGGANWSYQYALRSNGAEIQTRRHGLAAAFDPRSDRFIFAYLGDDDLQDPTENTRCIDQSSVVCDEIRLVTIGVDGTAQRHTLTGVRSAVGPMVACGSINAENNCILTWVSTLMSSCIHWGHGRIDSDGDFILANDEFGCVRGYSPVPVVQDQNDLLYPWRFAYAQEHSTNFHLIYTYRKSNSITASWVDGRTVDPTQSFRILSDFGLVFNSAGNEEKLHLFYGRK